MNNGPPAWLGSAILVPPFDARVPLAAGEDPFDAIMVRVQGIAEGGTLVVDAPFNPSPLRRVLAGNGFSSYARKLAEGHWRVFFHKDGGQDWDRAAEVDVSPEGAMSWREEDGLHLDVRKLAPPLPMLAILGLIERMETPEPLVVHHEREPRFLIPELAERGWRIVRTQAEFANVRLWLEHCP